MARVDGTPLKSGDVVTVRGAAGAVVGRVEECRAAEDLPELPDGEAPPATLVKVILREFGVRAVAMIAYDRARGERVCFAALWFGDGVWVDLQGQLLRIERR